MGKSQPKAIWKPGRGLLGPMKPLLGRWRSQAVGTDKASAMECTREFAEFGANYVLLDARWRMGQKREYREVALFGKHEDGALACWSFTNDGKRSLGHLADGGDIHPQAVAFEAQMPAGLARMIYWPDDDQNSFNFAVESKTKKGWNRFFHHIYRPQT